MSAPFPFAEPGLPCSLDMALAVAVRGWVVGSGDDCSPTVVWVGGHAPSLAACMDIAVEQLRCPSPAELVADTSVFADASGVADTPGIAGTAAGAAPPDAAAEDPWAKAAAGHVLMEHRGARPPQGAAVVVVSDLAAVLAQGAAAEHALVRVVQRAGRVAIAQPLWRNAATEPSHALMATVGSDLKLSTSAQALVEALVAGDLPPHRVQAALRPWLNAHVARAKLYAQVPFRGVGLVDLRQSPQHSDYELDSALAGEEARTIERYVALRDSSPQSSGSLLVELPPELWDDASAAPPWSAANDGDALRMSHGSVRSLKARLTRSELLLAQMARRLHSPPQVQQQELLPHSSPLSQPTKLLAGGGGPCSNSDHTELHAALADALARVEAAQWARDEAEGHAAAAQQAQQEMAAELRRSADMQREEKRSWHDKLQACQSRERELRREIQRLEQANAVLVESAKSPRGQPAVEHAAELFAAIAALGGDQGKDGR